MDLSSVVGIILALVALLTGMVLKGVSLSAFYNPAAILIIIFGTISAVTIAFPMKELKRVPKLFKILFKETKSFGTWVQTWAMNFPMAICYQMFYCV